jgi:uncharacterized protein
MTEKTLTEHFGSPHLAAWLDWFNPPANWRLQDSRLVIEPDAKTDFWQKTHYGFSADNGHFLFARIHGDFILSTRVHFHPSHQYDQAGLMVRFSSQCWLKTSVEYEPVGPSKLGAVVTNQGYSDWSTQDFPTGNGELELRIRREGDDFLVEYRQPGRPGSQEEPLWTQIRLAHLEAGSQGVIQAGLYACSPTAIGYQAEFDFLIIQPGRIENQ